MNKKLLLGALLVCGMGTTFTSCVDDTESASVTALRNAKAEQIKALAEVNKANADRIKLLAESEKALKDAEVEYQKARTAYQEAQNETERANASIALQKAQAELNEALAKAEATIAGYKYYEQNYKNQLAGLENAEANRLKGLIDAYKTASQDLIDAKKNLAVDNMELTRLETGRVNAKQSLLNDIANLEEENEGLTAQIAEQQSIIDTYNTYAGKTVTEQEVQDAHVKLIEAREAEKTASANYTAASNAENNANSKLTGSNYITDVVKFIGYDYTNPSWYATSIVGPTDGYPTIDGYWSINFTNPITQSNYYEYYETDPIDGEVHKYVMGVMYISQYSSNSSLPKASLGKWNVVIYKPNHELTCTPIVEPIVYSEQGGYTTYLNLINDGKGLEDLASYMDKVYDTEYFNKQVENAKKNLANLEKTQADAQKAFDTADKAYTDAKAATATAKAAYEAAKALADKEGATEAQKTDAKNKLTAYKNADSAESTAQITQQSTYTALKTAITNVNDCKALINSATADAEMQQQAVEEFKSYVAAVIASAPSNEENLTAYNNAVAANSAAQDSYTKAQSTANTLQGAYDTLKYALENNNGVVGGNADANYAIQNAQNNINSWNSQIESNKSLISQKEEELAKLDTIDGTNDYGEFYEQLIAEKKAEIEKDQAAVDAAQQKYDIAKAELDAAMADSAE